MRVKDIWILNFVSNFLLLVFLSGGFLTTIHPGKAGEDNINVYAVVFVGLYAVVLTYLFYERIYLWGAKRKPFHIITVPIIILSFILAFSVLFFSGGITTSGAIILILCVLSIVTYFWALFSEKDIK